MLNFFMNKLTFKVRESTLTKIKQKLVRVLIYSVLDLKRFY